MTIIAEHHNPIGKVDSVDTWRKRRRIAVPTAAGTVVDLRIVTFYETTSVNGQPLDLLIEAQTTKNEPAKQFGVIFSQTSPDRSKYNVPVLWREEGKPGIGQWR
jgi:hypothetical protein